MHLLKISNKDYEWMVPLTDDFRQRHQIPDGQVFDHSLFCCDYGIAQIITTPLKGFEGVIGEVAFGFESEADLLLFVMRYKR